MLLTHLLPVVAISMGGGHAELHPAGANLYLQLSDTRGVFEAYEQTALYRLVHDDEVVGMVAKLAGEDPETFDIDEQLLDALDEVYAENPEALLVQTMLGDVTAASISISGVELRGLGGLLKASNFEWSGELNEHFAPLQVRVVVEYPQEDEAVLAKMFDTMTAMLPVEGGERTLKSVEIASLTRQLELSVWTNPEWLGREIFATRDGTRIVLGVGVDAATAFAKGSTSLAADSEYVHCGTEFAGDAGVEIYDSYCDIDGLSELGSIVSAIDDAPEIVTEITTVAVKLIHPGGHIQERSRVRIVDGRFLTESLVRDHDDGAALKDVLGQTPVTADSFGLVPEEAVAVWATTVDKQAMGDLLMRAIGSATADDPELFLSDLEAQFGLRPRRDIIDSMGESLVFYTMPFSGIGAPKMFLALELSDPDAFAQGLEKLGGALAGASGGVVEFRAKPYRKNPFMSFSPGASAMSDAGGDMTALAPAMFDPNIAIGILDGRAIASLSNIYTKREMKRLLKGSGAAHALASAEDELPDGVVSYGTTDWGKILGSLYGAVKGMLPLVQQAMGDELPFSVEDLPGDDLFNRYFAPTTSWSRKTADGTYSFSESSFGPEVPALLLSVSVGGLFATMVVPNAQEEYIIEAQIERASEEVFEGKASPIQSTRRVLSNVKVGIVVFQSDLGHYPASLDELVKPSTNFPDGYLDGTTVPVDGWGNALHYERAEDGGSFRIWSAGPNGGNDSGAGDDVNLGKRR